MTRLIKPLLAAVLTVVALSSLSAATPQNRNLDFRLVNGTRYDVVELYLSPTTEDEWGDDVLGMDLLEAGKSADIKFSSRETSCIWDLKIVDEDDDEVVWKKLNLCTANVITLKYENGQPTAIIK